MGISRYAVSSMFIGVSYPRSIAERWSGDDADVVEDDDGCKEEEEDEESLDTTA